MTKLARTLAGFCSYYIGRYLRDLEVEYERGLVDDGFRCLSKRNAWLTYQVTAQG
jgi:hypothetical protein